MRYWKCDVCGWVHRSEYISMKKWSHSVESGNKCNGRLNEIKAAQLSLQATEISEAVADTPRIAVDWAKPGMDVSVEATIENSQIVDEHQKARTHHETLD